MLNNILSQLFDIATSIQDDDGLDYIMDDIYTVITDMYNL